MASMPRPRDPHLHRQISRHGKTVWYVRRGKGQRIRLRSEFGTDAFKAEYLAALSGEQPTRDSKAKPGSLQWLWEEYRKSGAWSALSPATRRQRENIMLGVMKVSGHEQADAVRSKHIEAGGKKDISHSYDPGSCRAYLTPCHNVVAAQAAWARKRR